MPSFPANLISLSMLPMNCRKTEYTFPVVRCFTWKLKLLSVFMNGFSENIVLLLTRPRPLKLTFLTTLVTLRPSV